MILQGDNPMGDIAALAATLYGNVQNSKREKADRDRQAGLDAQQASAQAATQQYQQSEMGRTKAELNQSGYDPQGNKLPPSGNAPHYEMPKPGMNYNDMATLAAHNYLLAASANNGQGDPDGIATWGKATQIIPRSGEEQANIPLRGAQTDEVKQRTKNLVGQFEHDIDMLKARGANAKQIAGIRAAYHRAGGGGGAGTAAAAQRAMLSAMNEAARAGVSTQNSEMASTYREAMDLHDRDPDTYPDTPSQPQYLPYPVMVPNGSGGTTTIYVDSSGHVSGGGNSRTDGGGGGSPQGNARHGLSGVKATATPSIGASSAPPSGGKPAKMQAGGTTYYLHSDGKYYTSPP